MSQNASLVLLHLIVFIFGFTGILGELITLPSNLIVLYRCAIAWAALLVFGVIWKRLNPLPLGKMMKIMGVGVITGIHWLLFFESIKVSTVSVGVAIMASTALWIALFEPLVTRRKIDYRELILGLLVILGLGIIFSVELQYKWGIFLAILSAMFAAMFSVFNGMLIKSTDSTTISFYEMMSAAIVMLLWSWFKGNLGVEVSGLNWLYLIVLGVLATAFAFVVSVEIMKQLSPFTVGLTINLEPIYTIILALIIFGDQEHMKPGFYLGTVILIGAIFLDTFMRRRQKKKTQAKSSEAT